MTLQGITMSEAKSRDPYAEFQTIHLKKCFKWQCNQWTHSPKFQQHPLDYIQITHNPILYTEQN